MPLERTDIDFILPYRDAQCLLKDQRRYRRRYQVSLKIVLVIVLQPPVINLPVLPFSLRILLIHNDSVSYCCTIYSFALLKPFPWTLVALDMTTKASGSIE